MCIHNYVFNLLPQIPIDKLFSSQINIIISQNDHYHTALSVYMIFTISPTALWFDITLVPPCSYIAIICCISHACSVFKSFIPM